MTVRRTKSLANPDDEKINHDSDDQEELEITPIEVEIEQLQLEHQDAEAEEDEAKDSVTSDDIYKMIKDAEKKNRVKNTGSAKILSDI